MSIPLPTAPAEPRPVFTLTAADICMACGARAYIRAEMGVDDVWLFCVHHGRQHEGKLRHLAIEWLDESAAILA